MTDDEQRKNSDQRRIGKPCEQRRRTEQISSVRADDGKDIKEDQKGREDSEGGKLQRDTLDAEQDDRGNDDAVGDPHLPGVNNLHARIIPGDASCWPHCRVECQFSLPKGFRVRCHCE